MKTMIFNYDLNFLFCVDVDKGRPDECLSQSKQTRNRSALDWWRSELDYGSIRRG